jgi:GalNAc-alpha-(1->4)-GalNAc-alpha-(1->3)-diNAcBac-PP-undecaprenol alpha-1,4-N-acetyl-D-galactosaminyltransferase
MPPVKIALVIATLAAGGAQRVMSLMANYWAQRNWDVTIFTLDDGSITPHHALDARVKRVPLDLLAPSASVLQGLKNNLRRIKKLGAALKALNPQAVISFSDEMNIQTLLAMRRSHVPVVVSERIDPAMWPLGKAWEFLRGHTYPRAACVVVQTERGLQYFSEAIKKVGRVIPNPVVVPEVAQVSRMREGESRKILGLGRLTKQKGFDLLLRAFAKVAAKHPRWLLEIWGEGGERPVLEALRDELKLQGRVRLPGQTSESFEKLRAADLFVLSSRFEGIPNALCEAMACGLPSISFDCPTGPREIITPDVDGVLVPPEDVEALALALDRVMGDEAFALRLGENARAITQRHSIDKVMAQWEEVLARAIAR